MSEGRGRVRTGGYVGFADLPNQVCQHSTSDDVTFRVVTSLSELSDVTFRVVTSLALAAYSENTFVQGYFFKDIFLSHALSYFVNQLTYVCPNSL